MQDLITPYGGTLIDLCPPAGALPELKDYAGRLPSVQISARAACDLELLATGAFSPLNKFMGRADYERVLGEMRCADGTLFPLPVTLPLAPGPELQLDKEVALRDEYNNLLAVLRVEEIYEWSPAALARHVCGTEDSRHPLVAEMAGWGRVHVAGRLRLVALPKRNDFAPLRLTPANVRERLTQMNATQVVAFQTRNPLHRAHEELTKRAMQETGGILLLHPVVGLTKPGDVDHFTRVRTYQALIARYYDPRRALLALLPLAMRMAGPREALWHALIRRNYGANHLIVGRDHASPGLDSHGKPFYGPYDAQELVEKYSGETGVRAVPFQELIYLPDERRYAPAGEAKPGKMTLNLSGTQVRDEYLNKGRTLPDWFTRPEVAQILAESYPPRHRQGFCIWFTGLSGSGKSTTAEALAAYLLENGRQTTLLDGDVVRLHLSQGLGFSKDDRDTNIRRIGFVAAEITRHGGAVLCAAVSPYQVTRNDARRMVGENFIEIFVDTPLEVCEQRDSKGMYAKARRGEIKHFTGIDDPYEVPSNAEITLDTTAQTPEANARIIFNYLTAQGLVRSDKSITAPR